MAENASGASQHVHRHMGELIGEIRAVTLQTLTNAPSLEIAALRLDGRLAAIARAQSSLANGDGATDLEVLIGEELRAGGIRENDATVVAGPKLRLEKRAATAVTLGLHELAAASSSMHSGKGASGSLEISWSVALDDGRRWIRIMWREEGSDLRAGKDDHDVDSHKHVPEQGFSAWPDLSIAFGNHVDASGYLLSVPLD